MQYFLSKIFQKEFKKLPRKIKNKAIEQLQIFIINPVDQKLGNHRLHGEWASFRSINITGDIRAVYKVTDHETVIFVTIGSHSKLYE